jgi:hypothetical protein
MQEDASDDVDQYNFSGWNIGGRNNKYGVRQARRSKPQQTTDQVQSKPTTRQMGGYPHPPGAISYAYSFTPYHQYHYPPPPPYGQMAAGGGDGGGYYGGYHHHGQGYGYPGQFPPPHHGNCCCYCDDSHSVVVIVTS